MGMFGRSRAWTWERGVKLNLVSQKKRQVCVFGWSTAARRDQVVERQSIRQKYGRYSTTATGPQVQSAFSVLMEHISHSLTLTPSVLTTAELKEGHESFTTIRLSKNRLKYGFTHTCDLQQHWEWFKGLPAGGWYLWSGSKVLCSDQAFAAPSGGFWLVQRESLICAAVTR